MIKLKTLSIVLSSVGLLSLVGCAATEKAETKYTDDRASLLRLSDNAHNATVINGESRTSNFNKIERNYVNPKPLFQLPEQPNLPAFFNKNVTVTMPGTVTAVEVLSELQRAAKINFKLDKDIYDNNSGLASIIKDGGGSSNSNKQKNPVLVSDFVYQGSLKDALDLFTAKTGLSWKWSGLQVELYKFESVSYKIFALSGTVDSSSSVNLQGDTSTVTATAGNSSSGNSAATSLQNKSQVSRSAKMAIWDDIKTTVLSLMSSDGSLAISESMGTITVRDNPFVQQKVAKIIEEMNTTLTGQILLNVDIYEVTLSDGDDLSFDWTIAWQKLGGKYGFNMSSLGGASSSSSNISMGVVDGNFKGTSAMIGALSTLGRTSVLNSFTVTTLNGQPSPIAVNRNIGYLKSVTRDQSGTNNNVSYSLEPGNVSVGVNINVKPKILNNNEVLLEYVMNLSDMERLRQVSSPDNSSMIEIPTTNTKSASQTATLKSGQTLILSGFKQQSSTLEDSGMGHSKNILLGGKRAGTIADKYLVVTVTPYIAKSGRAK